MPSPPEPVLLPFKPILPTPESTIDFGTPHGDVRYRAFASDPFPACTLCEVCRVKGGQDGRWVCVVDLPSPRLAATGV